LWEFSRNHLVHSHYLGFIIPVEKWFAMSDDQRFARRLSLKVKSDQVEDYLRTVRESVHPDLRKQPGIRRMYLLRSRQGGTEFISLTFWNSKAEADDYGESSLFTHNLVLLGPYLESEPVLTEFDVEYHDVNAESLPPPETAMEKVERSLSRSSKRKATPKKAKKTRKRKSR
jgi:heme-degrading monooxygenase HmoA